jgi:hypothetical protein
MYFKWYHFLRPCNARKNDYHGAVEAHPRQRGLGKKKEHPLAILRCALKVCRNLDQWIDRNNKTKMQNQICFNCYTVNYIAEMIGTHLRGHNLGASLPALLTCETKAETESNYAISTWPPDAFQVAGLVAYYSSNHASFESFLDHQQTYVHNMESYKSILEADKGRNKDIVSVYACPLKCHPPAFALPRPTTDSSLEGKSAEYSWLSEVEHCLPLNSGIDSMQLHSMSSSNSWLSEVEHCLPSNSGIESMQFNSMSSDDNWAIANMYSSLSMSYDDIRALPKRHSSLSMPSEGDQKLANALIKCMNDYPKEMLSANSNESMTSVERVFWILQTSSQEGTDDQLCKLRSSLPVSEYSLEVVDGTETVSVRSHFHENVAEIFRPRPTKPSLNTDASDSPCTGKTATSPTSSGATGSPTSVGGMTQDKFYSRFERNVDLQRNCLKAFTPYRTPDEVLKEPAFRQAQRNVSWKNDSSV